MNHDTHSPLHEAVGPARRKPCIALMGEFSAGKSTLSNLLIGQSPLPVKVTATQLPPVRISHGRSPGWRQDHSGNKLPLDVDTLAAISPADTRLVQLYLESDLLELCDLIDMPGISDPNMASEVWEGAIGLADGVIWCTHATQAWRQSEAAVWEGLSGKLAASSLLLLTRCDKLVTPEDKARVLKRVRRETEGQFADVLPISLTQAVEGRNDLNRWRASGAEDFSRAFVTLLNTLQGGAGVTDQACTDFAPAGPARAAAPADADMDEAAEGVRPRRVMVDREHIRSSRPRGDEAHPFDFL